MTTESDQVMQVKITRAAFEMLVNHIPGIHGVAWGTPDEDGFYTPAIWKVEPPPTKVIGTWEIGFLGFLGGISFGAFTVSLIAGLL